MCESVYAHTYGCESTLLAIVSQVASTLGFPGFVFCLFICLF